MNPPGPLLESPLVGTGETTVVQRLDGWWRVTSTVAMGALRLSDANPAGKLLLCADPDGPFASELGVGPGRAELFDGGLVVASVAPGSWLALTPSRTEDLVQSLLTVLDASSVVMIERSAGLALLRLTGPDAPLVLNAGTDHDLAAERFADGQAVSTSLVGARALIVRDDVVAGELQEATGLSALDLVPSYLVVCDRSLAVGVFEEVLRSGEPWGIEAEGFVPYRARHNDV